jgi:hypothetical protein
MRTFLRFSVLCVLIAALGAVADAQWRCLYATWDDDATDSNAIGTNTPSVGVIKPDFFMALGSSWSTSTGNTECYMLPYLDADSGKGRRYTYGYGGAATGVYQSWSDGGFDQVQVFGAMKIKATSDSLIYVANNDPDHNVLVFKYASDTINVVAVNGVYPRQPTGTNRIHGIDVDAAGYVYVCNDTSTGQTQDLKVYRPVKQWTADHSDNPLTTINLPDGIYRGIGVSPDGSMIFVADYGRRTVVKYKGSPAAGYTLDASFSFAMPAADTISATVLPAPMGLAYLPVNNILAIACHVQRGGGTVYRYGRIYMVNPNTGALISSDTLVNRIDVAAWNFSQTASYSNRPNGTLGVASGYASCYDVKWDVNKNLYTQSYYGWTVDKWAFDGTLPTIIVTGVDLIGSSIPDRYILSQNYPNPFNPTTMIEFSMPQSGFASLRVYDLLGREIATLLNEEKPAGSFRASFDASHLTSGTYYYVLNAGNFTATKKMVLVK